MLFILLFILAFEVFGFVFVWVFCSACVQLFCCVCFSLAFFLVCVGVVVVVCLSWYG